MLGIGVYEVLASKWNASVNPRSIYIPGVYGFDHLIVGTVSGVAALAIVYFPLDEAGHPAQHTPDNRLSILDLSHGSFKKAIGSRAAKVQGLIRR
jgi:hypothetical protein